MRSRVIVPVAVSLVACDQPSAPERPTWADVEPILRASCTGCHGATAGQNGRGGETVYRFDFYAITEETCGEAARAVDDPQLAEARAKLIGEVVTPPPGGGQARMPPSPGPALADWERDTLTRWAADPLLGAPRPAQRLPTLELTSGPASPLGDTLDFTVLVEDPDGEAVVGVLKLGPETLKIRGPGSFHVRLDISRWPAGRYPAAAVLCDGWGQIRHALPDLVKER